MSEKKRKRAGRKAVYHEGWTPEFPLYSVQTAAQIKGVPESRVWAAIRAGLLEHTYRMFPSGRTLTFVTKRSLERWDGKLSVKGHMPLSELLRKYGGKYKINRDFVVNNFIRTGRLRYRKIGGRIFVNETDFFREIEPYAK